MDIKTAFLWKVHEKRRSMSVEHEWELIESLERELSDGIANIVSSAIENVYNYARDQGIYQAMDEIKTISQGDYVQIVFESGQTDFSTPSWEMLPSLVAGGKVSKDGDLYRRIPIGSSNGKKPRKYKDISEGLSSLGKTTQKLEDSARNMAANFNMGRSQVVEQREGSSSIVFATASTKQDPSKSWIYPAKNMDMSFVVSESNYKIIQETDELIRSTIERYVDMLEEDY